MFILRIGAEALKISDYSLSADFKHSTVPTPWNPSDQQKHHTSILYNLLNQKNIENSETIYTTPLDRPSSSNSDLIKPIPIRSAALRTTAVAKTPRFHPYSILRPVPFHEQSANVYHDDQIVQWLAEMVATLKSGSRGSYGRWNDPYLRDDDRKKILKQSWHLIFITNLAEFIQANNDNRTSIMGLFIKDYGKTFDTIHYKKLSRLTRKFTMDVEKVIGEIIDLNFNKTLFQIFREAILCIDRQEDSELKKMAMMKPLLLCHTDEYYRLFDEMVDNIFKLDIVMAESLFCGHISKGVESIIDELSR